MDLIYRVVNADRMSQVEDLWAYCFEKKDDPFFQYYFQKYCGKDNTVIGGFENIDDWDYLRTMLHVNPYMLRLRGSERLTPYLVGIATAPEARGRHLLRGLLETTFEVLRSQHFTFCFLLPRYAGIYLPYQFAYCYYRLRYLVQPKRLSELEPAATISLRRCSLAEAQATLAPLYADFTAAVDAAPLRTDFQWQKLLTVHGLEATQCVIAYREARATGYMFYKIAGDTCNILELISADAETKRALLRYAASHEGEASSVDWLAEPWDQTFLYFQQQSDSPQLMPFMMARCLDARQALATLPVPQALPESSVVLLLTDNLLDRNNHLLKLKTAPGKLKIGSTLEDEEITMDMGAFTQLYFGTFTAKELAESGRIKAAAPDKLALLTALFPKQRTWINEFF